MPHFWETMSFGTVNYLALPATVLFLMGLAFAFDFLNGVHDSANSVATVVSTRFSVPSRPSPGRRSSISSPSRCST